VLVITALAVTELFRSRAAPPPEAPPSIPATATGPGIVTVGIVAVRDVRVVVRTDGKQWEGTLAAGEQRSFQGSVRIEILLSEGRTAKITVNGHSLGLLGSRGEPFAATYGPRDFRRTPSPSPKASAGTGASPSQSGG